mmetsp:Transcript_28474/g.71104  ORF Transcript_28474/g.71104 Transcript_28474/m.71104 type:complete len:267 (-) Transcript_28474:1506-2306(-)
MEGGREGWISGWTQHSPQQWRPLVLSTRPCRPRYTHTFASLTTDTHPPATHITVSLLRIGSVHGEADRVVLVQQAGHLHQPLLLDLPAPLQSLVALGAVQLRQALRVTTGILLDLDEEVSYVGLELGVVAALVEEVQHEGLHLVPVECGERLAEHVADVLHDFLFGRDAAQLAQINCRHQLHQDDGLVFESRLVQCVGEDHKDVVQQQLVVALKEIAAQLWVKVEHLVEEVAQHPEPRVGHRGVLMLDGPHQGVDKQTQTLLRQQK